MPPSQVVSTAQEYRSSTVAGSVTARRVLEWAHLTPLLELTVGILAGAIRIGRREGIKIE
jgi:hypothetical protein